MGVDGVMEEDPKQVDNIILDYFKKLFTVSNHIQSY